MQDMYNRIFSFHANYISILENTPMENNFNNWFLYGVTVYSYPSESA